METLSEIVGKNLVTLRKAKGMTQMQLAEEIHYSDKSISKWENGYALPTVDILLDLAQYYGVTVDYLCTAQSEEDIAAVINDEANKSKRYALRRNKILLMSIFALTVLLAAGFILISDFINSVYGERHYWLVMIWALPVIFTAEAIMSKFFFNNKWLTFSFASAAMWTLIIAFLLHYQIWLELNVWYVILAGIPLQAIFLLVALWKRVKPKKPTNKK